jgi:hypothetical protein
MRLDRCTLYGSAREQYGIVHAFNSNLVNYQGFCISYHLLLEAMHIEIGSCTQHEVCRHIPRYILTVSKDVKETFHDVPLELCKHLLFVLVISQFSQRNGLKYGLSPHIQSILSSHQESGRVASLRDVYSAMTLEGLHGRGSVGKRLPFDNRFIPE